MNKKKYTGISMLIFAAVLTAACAKAESSMEANEQTNELVEENLAVSSIEVDNEAAGFCANAFLPSRSRLPGY